MTKETKKFDAAIGKVLQLMIHSLYTNKDIFLRELISNSSDACDKLRYNAITDQKLLESDLELKIKIILDKEKNILIVQDNGIGMTKEELITNLGTIAHSGTQNFIANLSGDSKTDTQLIGQFGVGFYSAFMVANS
ncbi:MAG: molecular chaperone HtpG, partial [Rickettsiales bacterium]